MPKNNTNIALNSMADDVSQGIVLDKIHLKKTGFKTKQKPERFNIIPAFIHL